jgi:hypothetical protein
MSNSFSGLSIFIAPSVFSNVYLQNVQCMHPQQVSIPNINIYPDGSIAG